MSVKVTARTRRLKQSKTSKLCVQFYASVEAGVAVVAQNQRAANHHAVPANHEAEFDASEALAPANRCDVTCDHMISRSPAPTGTSGLYLIRPIARHPN